MLKVKSIGTWLALAVLAFAMIASGVGKLAGVEMLHDSFATMGLPAWFGYFIGAAEVLGGIAVLVPRLCAIAATGLAVIMAGAVYYYLAYTVESPFLAIVLLLLCGFAIYSRKDQAIWYPF